MGRISVGRAATVAAAFSLLVTACSDDEPDAGPPTTRDTTTVVTQPPSPTPYTERGEYEVGTYTVALDDGRRVVVWYPADASAADQPNESFDIASLLRPDLQALIPADLRVAYDIAAHPGADPAAGRRYPVVLFSHGFAGFPEQSVELTTHLASWGFVVAAPDHVERSLSGILGTAAQGVEPREATDVLSSTLDVVQTEDARGGSPLAGIVDAEHVAVAGHSAGANTAFLMTGDDRIDAFIAYSIERVSDLGELPPPDIPGMVMLGTDDGITPAEQSREVFEDMGRPKYLVEIGGAGHLVFSDICLIGADKGGVIAIGEQVGLPIEQFRELGTDGCTDEHPPVEDAFGAIDDLSVDFLRTHLGLQDEPAGLDDADIADAFDTVEIDVTAEP